MRYVAAYLLLALGGKTSPTSADIEKVLSSVGIEADKEKLEKVLASLKGKNLEQVIEEGKGKLASMPSGGAPVAAAAGGAAAAAPAAAGGSPEKKKEEEKDDDESDDDMGFGLFD